VRQHFYTAGCGTIYKTGGEGRVPLYVAPQREWVGLTKDEVNNWELPESPTVYEFAQFVEAKLKEKNEN
jgi:hypothetical protein